MQLPEGTRIKTFNLRLTEEEEKAVERALEKLSLWGSDPRAGESGIQHKLVKFSLQAGESAELLRLNGPACIVALRSKGDLMVAERRHTRILACVLRAYWDGELQPSIRAPLEYFFDNFTRTLALGKGKDGWHYCYLPMPFQKEAHFTLENQSKREMEGELEFRIRTMQRIPSNWGYLHACFRMDNATKLVRVPALKRGDDYIPVSRGKQDYIVLDTVGAGNYVATLLLTQAGGMEGDEHFFINGESWPPSYSGTGQEDYFNIAWGQRPVSFPTHGCVMGQWTGGITLLRVHLNDLIVFQKRIRAGFEHNYPNMSCNVYASIAYWYQREPHKPFPRCLHSTQDDGGGCPALSWKLDKDRKLFIPILPVEGESARILKKVACKTTVQDMLPYGTEWSGHKELLINPTGSQAFIELRLPKVRELENYAICSYLTTGSGYGKARFFLDRKAFAEVDCHKNAPPERGLFELGQMVLPPGKNFRFRIQLVDRSVGLDAFYAILRHKYIPAWQVLGPLTNAEDWDEERIARLVEDFLESKLKWGTVKVGRDGSLNLLRLYPEGKRKLFFLLSFLIEDSATKCELRLTSTLKWLTVFWNRAELEPLSARRKPASGRYTLRGHKGANQLLLGGMVWNKGTIRAWLIDREGKVKPAVLPPVEPEQSLP